MLMECNKSKPKWRYSPLKRLGVFAQKVQTFFFCLIVATCTAEQLGRRYCTFLRQTQKFAFGPNRKIYMAQKKLQGANMMEGRVESGGGVEVLL